MGQTPGEIRNDIELTRTRMSAIIDAIGYRLDVPARMRYRFSHIVHDVGGVFTGKPDGHDGGGTDLLSAGEEKMTSMLQSAQGGLAGIAGVVEERMSDAGQAVRTGLTDVKETVMETMTRASDTARTQAEGTADQMQEQMQEQMQQVRDTAIGTWRRIGGFARDNALALGLGAFAVGIIAGVFVPRSRMEQERIAPLAGEVRHKAVESGERALKKGQEMAEHAIDSAQSGMGGSGGQRTGEPVHTR